MTLRVGLMFLIFFVLVPPCGSQDAPSAATASAGPAGSAFPDRPVNWVKLIPNLGHDQKDIWLFPLSLARGRHLKPAFVLTAVTAGAVAMLDVPSGKYFQRTPTFYGFNRVFSGRNTAALTVAAPSAFYAISLLRRDSYSQHTFMLAGEAALGSEILTGVMKDIDRRLKPSQIPPGGDFSDTWFRSHDGSIVRGIGSFPSGHTIAAFSVATVFADRYPNPHWTKWAVYGLASVVGFSRVSLQSHHPSDAFAGALLGYSIAHYAVLRAP